MIGRLRGILVENSAPFLIVEAAGVGYEVEAPLSTCAELTQIGEEVILHTHLSISENAHQLFGFAKRRDRQLFRNLIKINGVGPKLGLAILSNMTPEVFVSSVMAEEVARLTNIPGVGKKTAERLVIELRDKLKDWQGAIAVSGSSTASADNSAKIQVKSHEVESALLALGYKPQQANQMISAVAEQADFATTATTELIRLALKQAAG